MTEEAISAMSYCLSSVTLGARMVDLRLLPYVFRRSNCIRFSGAFLLFHANCKRSSQFVLQSYNKKSATDASRFTSLTSRPYYEDMAVGVTQGRNGSRLTSNLVNIFNPT